jgi:hypothetical protein
MTCGITFSPERAWEYCPHPLLEDQGATAKVDRFAARNTKDVPLYLGAGDRETTPLLGAIQLNGYGRRFFNTKNPLPMTLSVGALEVGSAMIPTEFAIILPPIDPVFGDTRG